MTRIYRASEILAKAHEAVPLHSARPHPCRVCGCTTKPAGEAVGRRTGRTFHLQRCMVCGFLFVNDPWTDYASIYDDAYYRGEGSDPRVDYAREFESPRECVRHYEWRGLERIARHFYPAGGKWLDFGCGTGGLVRFVRASGRFEVMGHDTGPWAEKARQAGLPILTEAELDAHAGTFDFVTSIEVLEHLVDPVRALKRMRAMLKPGGTLFFTTGSTEDAPADIRKWSYLQPEIHVSYFNHPSMKVALERARFRLQFPEALPGRTDLVRCKCLRNLGVRRRNLIERILPWWPISRMVTAKYKLADYPVGIAC